MIEAAKSKMHQARAHRCEHPLLLSVTQHYFDCDCCFLHSTKWEPTFRWNPPRPVRGRSNQSWTQRGMWVSVSALSPAFSNLDRGRIICGRGKWGHSVWKSSWSLPPNGDCKNLKRTQEQFFTHYSAAVISIGEDTFALSSSYFNHEPFLHQKNKKFKFTYVIALCQTRRKVIWSSSFVSDVCLLSPPSVCTLTFPQE